MMDTFLSTKNKPVNSSSTISCAHCSLYPICLPKDADTSEIKALTNIIDTQYPLNHQSHLFKERDPFKAIFAVKSGCIKTYKLTTAGKEQVCGFYLPGELIGLDAIDSGRHTCFAQVIQSSSVCAIPYEQFEKISLQLPRLQQQLTRIMSREIASQQWLVTLLGKQSADERVAALLCNLAERYEIRGYSPVEFTLRMSRHDLGDYLGLAIETISRVLSRFHHKGLITTKGKHILLHHPVQLREIAGYC